jgi:hypothetical protein
LILFSGFEVVVSGRFGFDTVMGRRENAADYELNFSGLSVGFRMQTNLDVTDLGNQLTITLPYGILAVEERRAFVEFVKTEWTARQSQMTQPEVDSLAKEVDASWWSANKASLLSKIATATAKQ